MMFCRNCGKQIPDGAGFCSYCGAKQTVPQNDRQQTASQDAQRQAPPPYTQQQTASQNTQYQSAPAGTRQQKPKRKWTAILIPVLVFFICGMIGKFVLAPSFQSGSDSDDTTASSQSLPEIEEVQKPDGVEDTEADSAEETESNPAYTDLFMGTKVIHLPLMIGMDVECFAMKDENGNITCRDYGYQGDQVLSYVETWYFPGITADQQDVIQNYDNAAQEDAARYNGVACANITYSYDEVNEYYRIKYEFTDLDQPENCQALYDLGLTTGTNGLSLSKCEEMATADGFIKK